MTKSFRVSLLAAFVLASFPLAHASEPVSTRPILFVHGYSVFGFGNNCEGSWGKMETALRSAGFTGAMVTVGYYEDDTHCDVSIDSTGTVMTSIEVLSKDLAWYVYNNFSSKGQAVDIVAHSIGGLMTRYALYRVVAKDPGYPPFLKVAHVSTLGTPYLGYSLVAELCHVVVYNYQCDEMFPFSSFIEGLKDAQALLPEGEGGTVWGNIGSEADFLDLSDGVVEASSAESMDTPEDAKLTMPWYDFIFHTMYSNDSTVIAHVASQLSNGAAQPGFAPSAQPESSTHSPDVVIGRSEALVRASQVPVAQRAARIQPNLVNAEMQGVKFTNVLPGGLFAKMGIEENDVVSGCAPATRNQPFAVLAALETGKQPVTLDLCILRDGKQYRRTIRVQ